MTVCSVTKNKDIFHLNFLQGESQIALLNLRLAQNIWFIVM